MFVFFKTNNAAIKKVLIMQIARLVCNRGGVAYLTASDKDLRWVN